MEENLNSMKKQLRSELDPMPGWTGQQGRQNRNRAGRSPAHASGKVEGIIVDSRKRQGRYLLFHRCQHIPLTEYQEIIYN